MEEKLDIVALGSCTMDLLFAVEDIMRMELVDRDQIQKKYVAIENSSKLNVQEVKFYPGGSAANIACDLANIGYRTAYIGGIGKDSSGDACLQDLKKHHVDTSGVCIFPHDSTAHSVIIINSNYKDRSILAYKGANDLFGQDNVNPEMIKKARCFVWTSLTSNKGIDAIKHCIRIAKEAGIVVAGAPSISIIKKRPDEAMALLSKCDITSMNNEELYALTGEMDLNKGIKKLLNLGLKLVNVTLGNQGAWLTDGKTIVKTKPPKVTVSDTTGAGDATMAGIIYGYLEKKSLHETAQIAGSLSGMEIEMAGVRVGLPEKFTALEAFMKNHHFFQDTGNFE